jgi:hypothetical protein
MERDMRKAPIEEMMTVEIITMIMMSGNMEAYSMFLEITSWAMIAAASPRGSITETSRLFSLRTGSSFETR